MRAAANQESISSALLGIRTESLRAVEELARECSATSPSSIEAALGATLLAVLAAVSMAARSHGFDPEKAFDAAASKVQRRTPYMPEWGDGSAATSAVDAKSLWQQRKAQAAGHELEPNATLTPGGAAHHRLLFVVARLTEAPSGSSARSRCPWTAGQTTASMLGFLQEECGEAQCEVEAMDNLLQSGGATQAELSAGRRALISELGDVLFNILMAVAIAVRDHRVWPLDIYKAAQNLHLHRGIGADAEAGVHLNGRQVVSA